MSRARIPLDDLLPHRPPMLFIDSVSLPETADESGQAWTTVKDDWVTLNAAGELQGPAFFEIMAQGFGAIGAVRAADEQGEQAEQERPKAGFLVGVKKFACLNSARPGDELRVSLGNSMSIGPFHVVDAFVHRGEELLASGQVKVFLAGAAEMDGLLGAMQGA